MTSILTNNAATAVLQTLRMLTRELGEEQKHVSSGLRIGAADDNAAYWSISTTMKSDQLAVSAVVDAIGLGAAKVDVAYAATENIVDLLKEVKSRLVAATENGVDPSKIQRELDQLSSQAVDVAAAASFSGANWLHTDVPTHLQETSPVSVNLVTSFNRDASGAVSVATTGLDLRATSMFNSGGGGILQKDVPDFHMPLGDYFYQGTRIRAYEGRTFNGPVTFAAGESATFNLIIDRSNNSPGDTYSITVDRSLIDATLGTVDGVITDGNELSLILQQALVAAGASAVATTTGSLSGLTNGYVFQSLETSLHDGSSIYVESLAGSTAKIGLSETPNIWNFDNDHPVALKQFVQPFRIYRDATIKFDLSVSGSPAVTYTIDRAAVDAALGTSDGMITSPGDLKAVIDQLTAGIGMAVDVSGNILRFAADQTVYPGYGGRATQFFLSDFRPDPPFNLRFDLTEIDITSSTYGIDEYLAGVEHMLTEAISSAALLGSMKSRLELQEGFALKMLDSIDKGVGRLVDADMNESSTRLKALQTQRQLSTQALSIANTRAENLTVLFQ